MKNFLNTTVLLLASITGSYAQQPDLVHEPINSKNVLVLCASGVDPQKDGGRGNQFVKNLFYEVAPVFKRELQNDEVAVFDVLDQSTKLNIGEKFAIYVTQLKVKHVIKITLNIKPNTTKTGTNDFSLTLDHINASYIIKSGKVVGANIDDTFTKEYQIAIASEWRKDLSPNDMVLDFLKDLKLKKILE